ncbi:phosphate ABC transporter substrate-binding protein [Kaistia algarum]|nr:phosphate ABC transporter substrate-binding protein [Kaistia algarum]
MYGVNRRSVERLWEGFADHLRRTGLEAPDHLDWPEDLGEHWRRPDVLLSQTCGYPLVEGLCRDVKVVGAFQLSTEGCDGFHYRSRIVVRDADAGRALTDFRGRVAAFNSTDSQSGYNSLRALVAPLAERGRFFGSAIESGAHRRSLELVRSGAADLAAIDCVTFALVERFEPAELDGLCTIGWTEAAPGLPLITSGLTSRSDLENLRRAIERAMADPALAPIRDTLFISGFSRLDLADYARCAQMKRTAEELGYPLLA